MNEIPSPVMKTPLTKEEAEKARQDARDNLAKPVSNLEQSSELLDRASPKSILFMVVGLVAFVCAAFLRWA